MSTGYIEKVWNMDALFGLRILGLPVKELLFAASFGMYWAGVCEHFTWRHLAIHAGGSADTGATRSPDPKGTK